MRKPADLYEWVRWAVLMLATGFWLAVFSLAFGCGGGSSGGGMTNVEKPPIPITYNYRDFIPRESGIHYFQGGQWQIKVLAGDDFDVLWGNTWEEHRVVTYAGEPWLAAFAFRNVDPPARYEISVSRSEIDRGFGWVTLPPANFGPYVPLKLTGPVTVRQWGLVADNPYFWISTFTPQASVANSCWQGSGDSIRPGIKQQEAWHDKIGGWYVERGTGPLGADGMPLGTATYTAWFQTLGRDAGWLWQGLGTCLIR